VVVGCGVIFVPDAPVAIAMADGGMVVSDVVVASAAIAAFKFLTHFCSSSAHLHQEISFLIGAALSSAPLRWPFQTSHTWRAFTRC
jgi:hypothetical protein